MRKALLALALGFIIPVTVGATTLIVLRSPSRIVLAGDSLSTVAAAAGVRMRGGDCKVLPAGRRWWVAVGGFSGSAGVDVRALVVAAVAPSTTMAEALRAIQRLYDSKLHAGLQTGKFFYGVKERVGTPALTIYVAGMSDGALTVGRFGVDVESASPFTLTPYAAQCPGRMCPDGLLFVGDSVAAEPALKILRTTPRPPWLAVGDGAAALHLLQLQAVATPERVGPPFNVLELTPDGRARWFDRSPQSPCPPIH